jgi:hypothetical protein
MPADGLTKPLDKVNHAKFVQLLGLSHVPRARGKSLNNTALLTTILSRPSAFHDRSRGVCQCPGNYLGSMSVRVDLPLSLIRSSSIPFYKFP